MTIRLDLSFLSGDLSLIVNSEEIKSFSIDRSADVDYTSTTGRWLIGHRVGCAS
jgi:hypothetical protein